MTLTIYDYITAWIIFVLAIIIWLIFIIFYAKQDQLKKNHIRKLNDHDKAVILDYEKETKLTKFRNKKNEKM